MKLWHVTETISYIAWEPGTGMIDSMSYEVGTQSGVAHKWTTVGYGPFASLHYFLADMQTTKGKDICSLRYKNKLDSCYPSAITDALTHVYRSRLRGDNN